jgi:hypothetical protein
MLPFGALVFFNSKIFLVSKMYAAKQDSNTVDQSGIPLDRSLREHSLPDKFYFHFSPEPIVLDDFKIRI